MDLTIAIRENTNVTIKSTERSPSGRTFECSTNFAIKVKESSKMDKPPLTITVVGFLLTGIIGAIAARRSAAACRIRND
jgi:hypothetical protein